MRPVTIAVFCILVLSGCTTEVVDEKILPVTLQQQVTQTWCWAATTQMVSDYYSRFVHQCQVVSAFLNYNCCVDPAPCSNRAGQLYEIQQALYAVGLVSALGGPLPFGHIQSEISSGRPMIAAYTGSFLGHVVVIYGYRRIQNRVLGILDSDVSEVLIHDPYYGTFNVEWSNTFNYAGQLTWTSSIHSIRPAANLSN